MDLSVHAGDRSKLLLPTTIPVESKYFEQPERCPDARPKYFRMRVEQLDT